MADTLTDSLRYAADVGRTVTDSLGMRLTTAVVTVETYSAPIGTPGATITHTTATTLSPRFACGKIAPGSPSYFGGGQVVAATGEVVAPEYRLGPITKSYSLTGVASGGYTLAQLAPTGSDKVRVTYALSGDMFTGNERFAVVDVDGSHDHSWYVHLARVRT